MLHRLYRYIPCQCHNEPIRGAGTNRHCRNLHACYCSCALFPYIVESTYQPAGVNRGTHIMKFSSASIPLDTWECTHRAR